MGILKNTEKVGSIIDTRNKLESITFTGDVSATSTNTIQWNVPSQSMVRAN
jgi:hypothetical protein